MKIELVEGAKEAFVTLRKGDICFLVRLVIDKGGQGGIMYSGNVQGVSWSPLLEGTGNTMIIITTKDVGNDVINVLLGLGPGGHVGKK